MTTVYVVNIGDYLPELCAETIPTIEAYAERIGAEFELITERAFPEWPMLYEKMQVHERGKDNDWNILVDADTVISPALHDVREVVRSTHVGVYMAHTASKIFPADQYFLRDGRDVGLASNFVVTHFMTHDLWTPFEEPAAEVMGRLNDYDPRERPAADEYCLSRNLARFGLKFAGIYYHEDEHFLHLNATSDNKDGAVEEALAFKKKWGMV